LPLLASGVVNAATPCHDLHATGETGAARERRIDQLMARYQGAVPGAAVLIVQHGQLVLGRSYGLADLEARVPVSLCTDFRLASMTKQFTAAAILLLAEHGRLSLDDPLGKWLPELPAHTASIPLRLLLVHRSGIIDYEEVIPDDTSVPLHDADVLRLLAAQDRTYFPPGAAYRYSDSGYALLALIVGRASGLDFASYVRTHIFQPLGMSGSVAYEQGVSEVPHRAFGYSLSGERWQRTDQSLTSGVLGDGGIYSSVADLARWDAALYDSRLLSGHSRLLALSPATATDDPNVQYGFGWRMTGESIWHSGETIGFRNVIVRFPRQRFTVILLSNRNDPEPYTTALAIAALYLPGADAARAGTVQVGPDPEARPLPGSR
jgi:CubicO group peptidase (beta-lactamase class C family)